MVFATVAGEPHVTDVSWFGHNPVVLHVSLRDLAPGPAVPAGGVLHVIDDFFHELSRYGR